MAIGQKALSSPCPETRQPGASRTLRCRHRPGCSKHQRHDRAGPRAAHKKSGAAVYTSPEEYAKRTPQRRRSRSVGKRGGSCRRSGTRRRNKAGAGRSPVLQSIIESFGQTKVFPWRLQASFQRDRLRNFAMDSEQEQTRHRTEPYLLTAATLRSPPVAGSLRRRPQLPRCRFSGRRFIVPNRKPPAPPLASEIRDLKRRRHLATRGSRAIPASSDLSSTGT